MTTRIERTPDEWIARFQRHLTRAGGRHPQVCHNYARYVRAFLKHVHGRHALDVTDLSAPDVIGFIQSLVGRFRPSTINLASTALRSFFRFLRLEGIRSDHLENVVPRVAERRLARLPRHLDENELDRLLNSLDRSTPRARRDRAMILCVTRLGLRANEVVGLQLEDIDWRAGVLRVRTRKTGHGALLPLPADVGKAILEYLKDRGASTRTRYVFVLHHLRRGEPATQRTVYDAVKVAIDRAGVDAPIRGPNLLRHTLATHLIRRGASLKEVADLLGHRSLETTQIYAKLDLNSLRDVAQPWPEVKS